MKIVMFAKIGFKSLDDPKLDHNKRKFIDSLLLPNATIFLKKSGIKKKIDPSTVITAKLNFFFRLELMLMNKADSPSGLTKLDIWTGLNYE